MAAHKRILCAAGNRLARRSLFGPIDLEELEQEYQAALQKDLEEASNRWGFDFKLDKPRESSDFHWEGIPCTKIPLLYRSCMFGLSQPQNQRGAEAAINPKGGGKVQAPQREKENVPRSLQKCGFNTEIPEKTPRRREKTGLKRKQTNITDFYQVKRKVGGAPRKSGK